MRLNCRPSGVLTAAAGWALLAISDDKESWDTGAGGWFFGGDRLGRVDLQNVGMGGLGAELLECGDALLFGCVRWRRKDQPYDGECDGGAGEDAALLNDKCFDAPLNRVKDRRGGGLPRLQSFGDDFTQGLGRLGGKRGAVGGIIGLGTGRGVSFCSYGLA